MNKVKEIQTDSLTPHPKNIELYGKNQSISDILPLVEEHGIKRHLIIDQHNQIVDGVRRWLCAVHLGIETVLCETKEYESDEEIVQDILIYNRYRIKTPRQIFLESRELKRIEIEKARRRMGMRERSSDDRTGSRVNDILAEHYKMGRTKFSELEFVYENEVQYPKIIQGLDGGDTSVHGAFAKIRKSIQTDLSFQEKKDLFINTINKVQRQSLRELLLREYGSDEIIRKNTIDKLNEEIRRSLGQPIGETFEALWQQLNQKLTAVAREHEGKATVRRWYSETSRFITVTIRLDEQDAKPNLTLEHFKENVFVRFEEADEYAAERGGYCEGKVTYGAMPYWRLWIHPSFLETEEEEEEEK